MFLKMRDGVKLYVDIDGEGLRPDQDGMTQVPTLLLCHGGPGGDHSGFKPAYARLTTVAQVVYFDYRGCGRSGGNATDIEGNVRDIEDLRLALGLEAIALLGMSCGGFFALAYASAYPDKVTHLILSSTAAHSAFIDSAKQIVASRGCESQKKMVEVLWSGGFRDVAHVREYFTCMGDLYSKRFRPELLREDRCLYCVDAMNKAWGGYLNNFDLRSAILGVKAPTLVLCGEDDWICPPQYSVEIAERIPGARLTIVKECGHTIDLDQPEVFFDAIEQALTN